MCNGFSSCCRVQSWRPLSSYTFIKINLTPCHLLLYSICSLYLPKIVKFYRCIQLLQAEGKFVPFNLAHPKTLFVITFVKEEMFFILLIGLFVYLLTRLPKNVDECSRNFWKGWTLWQGKIFFFIIWKWSDSGLDPGRLFLLYLWFAIWNSATLLLFARCQHYNADDLSNEPDLILYTSLTFELDIECGAIKTGPPPHCNYSEIPWPNCAEIGELLHY